MAWTGIEWSVDVLTWLKNASIGVKISLSPAIGILCLLVMGCVGWLANQSLHESLEALSERRMPLMVDTTLMKANLADLNGHINQSLAWEGAGFKAAQIEELDKRIADELGRVGRAVDELAKAHASGGEGSKLSAKLASDYAKFRKDALDALDIKSGMVANAATFMSSIDSTYQSMNSTLESMVAMEKTRVRDEANQGRELASTNRLFIVGCFIVAMLLSSGVAFLCVRLIVRPLDDAARVAGAMSNGDFSEPVPQGTRDATGHVLTALGGVSLTIGSIVGNIRQTADQVSTASEEIASGNSDLSARTEQSASALEETASSLEQLSATIQNTADNAERANQVAQEAVHAATDGGAAVAEVISTMRLIDEQAKQIREITGIIDSIAFQTNILALNAAIEAARAGELGRGFAVVAQEVRSLAKRSGSAAQDIRALIVSSVEQVETGAKKVGVAGETMQRIVRAVENVKTTVQEISQATREQADGVAQASSAVNEMDRSTQQNAALVEEVASATESLRVQARALVDSIAALKTTETLTDVDGAWTAAPVARRLASAVRH